MPAEAIRKTILKWKLAGSGQVIHLNLIMFNSSDPLRVRAVDAANTCTTISWTVEGSKALCASVKKKVEPSVCVPR